MKDLITFLRPSAVVQTATTSGDELDFVEQLFQHQAAENPDHTAVISKAGRLTYGELNRKANQLAWYFKSRGAGPETLMLQFIPNPPIDSSKIIKLVQSRKNFKLSGQDRLKVEAKMPDVSARVQLLFAVLKDLNGS